MKGPIIYLVGPFCFNFDLIFSIIHAVRFLQKIMNKTTSGPYWVMYDNECGFCYSIVRFFRRLNWFNKIQWVSKDWDGNFPDQYKAHIDKTIVVYDPSSNKAYYRSEAIYKILTCIPLGFIFAWILRIPFLLSTYDRFYDKISDNRNKICKPN